MPPELMAIIIAFVGVVAMPLGYYLAAWFRAQTRKLDLDVKQRVAASQVAASAQELKATERSGVTPTPARLEEVKAATTARTIEQLATAGLHVTPSEAGVLVEAAVRSDNAARPGAPPAPSNPKKES